MGQLRAMRRVHAHTRRRLAKSSALFMEYVLSSAYDDACVFSEVDGAHAYGEEKALEPTDDFGTSNETSLNMIHELTGSFDDHRDAPGDFVLIDDCASDWSVVTSAETDWVEVVPVAEDGSEPDATANDAALARTLHDLEWDSIRLATSWEFATPASASASSSMAPIARSQRARPLTRSARSSRQSSDRWSSAP